MTVKFNKDGHDQYWYIIKGNRFQNREQTVQVHATDFSDSPNLRLCLWHLRVDNNVSLKASPTDRGTALKSRIACSMNNLTYKIVKITQTQQLPTSQTKYLKTLFSLHLQQKFDYFYLKKKSTLPKWMTLLFTRIFKTLKGTVPLSTTWFCWTRERRLHLSHCT